MLRRTALSLEAVGFIGLGQMGARMVPNLFKSGSQVTEAHIHDVDRHTMEEVKKELAGKGTVVFHQSPASVAAKCKKIVTMLPNGKVVRTVFYDARNGIFKTLQKGTLLIDSSTIDPDTPKELAAVASARDSTFVDAPVSGGIMAAAGGTLTFMVGAKDDAAFELSKTVLSLLGKNIVHCGGVGSGQVTKLCNNLILAQHMVAVSEAMLMGTKLGVKAETLAKVINTSTGRCWTSELYNPYPGVLPNVPASRNYEGGFGAKLMLKDVGLAVDAAEAAGLSVKGAVNAKAMYQEMCDGGKGNLDFGGILKHIEEHSGKKAAAHDDHGHGHGGGDHGHGHGGH